MLDNRRQAIIVWLNHLKQVRALKRFGNVHYVSRRLKYAVLYCDMNDIEKISEKLMRFNYVNRVEPSFRPFLKTEYTSKNETQNETYNSNDVQLNI